MIPALFGLAAALGLGVADFMSRFSARALGAPLTYGAVLLVGTVGTSLWVLLSSTPLIWSPLGCAAAAVHGLFVALMCILLYAGLARGPIAVVAPIVAAHPALVLAANVVMGVRPSAAQWVAMTVIVAGGIVIAATAAPEDGDNKKASADRTTLLIASGACLAYAALVITGQAAVPLIGETQTMWIGRCSGLVFVVLILIFQRATVKIPSEWLPYVGLQGALDSLGYLAFLAGAATVAPHITMVIASAFSVVTVLLARLILHEAVSATQWLAIVLIAMGTAVLSSS